MPEGATTGRETIEGAPAAAVMTTIDGAVMIDGAVTIGRTVPAGVTTVERVRAAAGPETGLAPAALESAAVVRVRAGAAVRIALVARPMDDDVSGPTVGPVTDAAMVVPISVETTVR